MLTKITKLTKVFLNKLVASTKRFPEALLFAAAAVVTAIIINHMNFSYTDPLREQLHRLTMILALGVPVYLSIRVLLESIRLKRSQGITVLLSGILILSGYYFIFLKEINTIAAIRYTAASLALYLAFTFIPYFYKRDKYELYVVRLLTKLFTTYLYSIVLYLGLIAILFTIEQLFTLNITYKLYFDIFLIVAGIFAPVFFLADIPKKGEVLLAEDYPKVFRVMLQYIVMPLLIAYSTVLYVYFGKIIITRQWPQGMVSHLVLWFSIISTTTIFLVYQIKDSSQWTKTFAAFFPKWILPLLAMMFIAIGIRINAYGVTESRYFVVAAGLWVLGCMLYLSFWRSCKNTLLAISVAAIALVSTFGPLSAFSISKYSQNKRFEGLLQEYGMLQAGEIVKPQQISDEGKQSISSIISYFHYRHHLEDLTLLPKGFKLENMEEVLGFRMYDGIDVSRNYFSIYTNQHLGLMDIADYDFFASHSYYRYSEPLIAEEGEFSLSLDRETNQLKLIKGAEVVYVKALDEIAKALYQYNGKSNATAKELRYEDNADGIRLLYQFKHINGYETDGNIIVDSAEFYVFIKYK